MKEKCIAKRSCPGICHHVPKDNQLEGDVFPAALACIGRGYGKRAWHAGCLLRHTSDK